MKSAIGNSLLMSLVVIIVSLVMLVFVNVLSYSKAYRVKNRIIEIIERYGSYENESAKQEIGSYLKQVGYQLGTCAKQNDEEMNWVFSEQDTMGYKFCVAGVYENQEERTGYRHYIVTTYVEYNFPVINQILTTPVTGETKILGEDYEKYN